MWKKVLVFAGGVAVGSIVTWFSCKKIMYEEIARQVKDVKMSYGWTPPSEEDLEEQFEETVEETKPEILSLDTAKERAKENERRKQEIMQLEEIIEKENYNIFSNPMNLEALSDLGDDDDEDDDSIVKIADYPREGLADRPYVISQFDFINGHNRYDQITLNYYDDGILEEALSEEIIDDIDGVIGKDSLDKFGEFEPDVVFVRNERLGADYEVIRQYRDFVGFPKDEDG